MQAPHILRQMVGKVNKIVISVVDQALYRISALADIDTRLVEALRAIRGGTFSYVKGTMPPRLTTTMVADMGCPPAWGDPSRLPAYGNHASGTVYESLSVKGRHGLGGLPCEVVHGRVDQHSCVANSARRGGRVFLKALLIYTPVRGRPSAILGRRY